MHTLYSQTRALIATGSILLTALLVALPTEAQAQKKPRVVVFPLEAQDSVPDKLAKKLTSLAMSCRVRRAC